MESILRQKGYKTGMYTSPHLVSVRERIQINGVPISKGAFEQNFWYCWRKLVANGGEKVNFFRFLTIMGMKVIGAIVFTLNPKGVSRL